MHDMRPSISHGYSDFQEQQEIVSTSRIAAKYNEEIDRDSAYEMLARKLSTTSEEFHIKTPAPNSSRSQPKNTSESPDIFTKISKNPLVKSVANTVVRKRVGSYLSSKIICLSISNCFYLYIFNYYIELNCVIYYN